ncbi:hypothetical protein C8R34_12540 [Nitrosomonas sp. Nm84]|nr:hypothetical protein C8R34_12540 [Nitrosomonas sp. Nm84]
MPRLILNDEFWSKLGKTLLQEAIYNKCNLRMTVKVCSIECGLAASGETYLRLWMLEFHLQKIQCVVIKQ